MRIATLIVGVAAACIGGCAGTPRKLELPRMEVRGSASAEPTADATEVTFDVLVANPFKQPMSIQTTAYVLNVEGQKVAQGREDLRVKNVAPSVAAGQSRAVPVTAKVRPADVLDALGGARGGDTVSYDADVYVTVDSAGAGVVTLTNKATGTLTLPLALAIEMQGVLFDPAGGPGDGWVGVAVTNRNATPVTVQAVALDVILSSRITAGAVLSTDRTIAPGEKAELNLPIRFSPALAAGSKPAPGDVIGYEVRGTATCTGVRGTVSIPVKGSGKTPVAE